MITDAWRITNAAGDELLTLRALNGADALHLAKQAPETAGQGQLQATRLTPEEADEWLRNRVAPDTWCTCGQPGCFHCEQQ